MKKYILAASILLSIGCNSQPVKDESPELKRILTEEIATLNSQVDNRISMGLLAIQSPAKKEKTKLDTENMISKSDLDANFKEHWFYILGILGTGALSYLAKEIISARANGIRDARLDIFEKLILGDKVTQMPDENSADAE